MQTSWHRRLPWIAAWLVLLLAGALLVVRIDIAQRREAFMLDARTAHRLLSQRTAQHEAILATLVLLGTLGDDPDRPEARLPAVYPQLLSVLRRDGDAPWTDAALQAAEERSRATRRPVIGAVDPGVGQYTLVLSGAPSSFALRIDMRRTVPWTEWPFPRNGPVAVALGHEGRSLVVQPGPPRAAQPAGLTPGFVFTQALSSPSQPFELQLRQATGPAQWPWGWLAAWAVLSAFLVSMPVAWLRNRRERRRAEALLRVGQVARLNTLGELAGGIAHELNQPLAAVLANAQAARRLLDERPPALDTARDAMTQAAAQARRAADVVARLRRLLESPDASRPRETVRLDLAVREVLELLEPEARRRSVRTAVEGEAPAVLADRVALEQIVHNLIVNAMQALEDVPVDERRLTLRLGADDGCAVLAVRDSGPGIPPEALPRLFEPFFTTRAGGLGLGLSLCETLAQSMQGRLLARNVEPRGAEFVLALPIAARP